ncbi:MAG: glycosyltransferase family 39 protein [Micromonosporaceae bacterium]|nr:glycosyltransferase family 39 protein [Micromonosporaceae bacterium]
MSNEALALQARTKSNTEVTSEPVPGRLSGRVRAWLGQATWFWPVVTTTGLVLYPLGGPVLWQDELVTLDVARRSVDQILGLVPQVDAVHATYYLFMHFWVQVFGESAFALRLPSALAMGGAAGCVALIGRRLYRPATGVVSGLVFALTPAVTRFGQEARSYGFVVLAAALATLLLLRAVERPSVLRWAGYAASVAACVVFNAVSGAIVVGHLVGLVVLLWRRWAWRPVVGFVAAVGLAGAAAYPVVRLAMKQALRQVHWVPRFSLLETWQSTVASVEFGYAMLALALVAWLARPPRATAFLTVAVAMPLLAISIYSLGEVNYFFSKYLLFVLPASAVLVGAGLAAVRWRWAPVVGLVALALLGLPDHVVMRSHLSHSWYTYPLSRPMNTGLDYETAAKIIVERYQPGDGAVYQRGSAWWYMIDVGVKHYLPESVRPRDVFLLTTAGENHELWPVECATECLGGEPRLWVVVAGQTDDVISQLQASQAEALRSTYVQTWVTHSSGLTVGLLERRS